jgi:hypothetical protein
VTEVSPRKLSVVAASQCAGVVPLTYGTAPSMYGSITSSGRPKLTWSPVSGALSYQLFRRYLPAEPDWFAVTGQVNFLSYTDNPNVVAGGGNPRYEYHVVAYSNYWCGGYILPSPPSLITSFKAANGGGPI